MIPVKRIFEHNKLSNKMLELCQIFSRLEKALEYPNCEGYLDEKRYLEMFERELKEKGFI